MFDITLGVTKQRGRGAHEFFDHFRELMQDATTWKVQSAKFEEATIISTASLPSLPTKPRWKLSVHQFSGSVVASLENEDLTEDQQAHAVGYFIYLCLTHLSSFVNKIEITS